MCNNKLNEKQKEKNLAVCINNGNTACSLYCDGKFELCMNNIHILHQSPPSLPSTNV